MRGPISIGLHLFLTLLSTYPSHLSMCFLLDINSDCFESNSLASSPGITADSTSVTILSANLFFEWPGRLIICHSGKLLTATLAQVPLSAFARQLADKVCLSLRAFALGETLREREVESLCRRSIAPIRLDIACHRCFVISFLTVYSKPAANVTYKSCHF